LTLSIYITTTEKTS